MSYLHIDQLYKNKDILLFKKCFAMEKLHGTSAHISWKNNKISFFPGGCSYPLFTKLFDEEKLKQLFVEQFGEAEKDVTVYGEAYGGSMQGMCGTYGDKLKFIVFEVKVGEHTWLNVPASEKVALGLGLEFVDYNLIDTDLASLDAERAKPSTQAFRNGMGPDKKREGIVLRPPIEVRKNNGARSLQSTRMMPLGKLRPPESWMLKDLRF